MSPHARARMLRKQAELAEISSRSLIPTAAHETKAQREQRHAAGDAAITRAAKRAGRATLAPVQPPGHRAPERAPDLPAELQPSKADTHVEDGYTIGELRQMGRRHIMQFDPNFTPPSTLRAGGSLNTPDLIYYLVKALEKAYGI